MNGKTEVKFYCYKSRFDEGVGALFIFYNWDGDCWVWDEMKLIPEEALDYYPPDVYNWVMVDD